MESILAILCIVFFAVLTYELVQGRNLTKDHIYNCRTIFIPEEVDLELAYKSVKTNKNPSLRELNYLKKRARELGASKDFVDGFKEKNKDNPNPDYTKLKVFIVQNSISDKHIQFNKVEKEIKKTYKHGKGPVVMSLEEYNIRTRIDSELDGMNKRTLRQKAKTLGINLDTDVINLNKAELRELIKNKMLEGVAGIKDMRDHSITIKQMRKDAGIDDY